MVEIDGEVHRYQHHYDQDRQQALEALGLRVLRFKNSDVNENVRAVLAAILQACRLSKAEFDLQRSGH